MKHSSQQQFTPPFSSKGTLIRHYKPICRFLLIFNLALGGYMFAKARKKNTSLEDNKVAEPGGGNSKATANISSSPPPASDNYEEPLIAPSPIVIEPVNVRAPLPEDQQRELFKWILEENRKVKPIDPEEKKRMDEEKAILKKFIRAESITQL